ncbi:Redoxin-domain-containing protein [Xylariales sp. PMI_506]|nr:Redoxin-domain-containing protein [Xylariales sp. PMI_506]
MAFRAAFRRSPLATATTTAAAVTSCRSFHSTRAALVSRGDALPNLDVLVENSPGNKVNLAEEFDGISRGIVIGVPAAFSPACSQKHVPGYINSPVVKELIRSGGKVVVVSVNDPFVMKAWHDQLDPVQDSQIRFLGDPTGEFTKALELDFDSTAIFGNRRSKRYALVIEDGKVKSIHVEPDNTGTSVSLAENVLKDF